MFVNVLFCCNDIYTKSLIPIEFRTRRQDLMILYTLHSLLLPIILLPVVLLSVVLLSVIVILPLQT